VEQRDTRLGMVEMLGQLKKYEKLQEELMERRNKLIEEREWRMNEVERKRDTQQDMKHCLSQMQEMMRKMDVFAEQLHKQEEKMNAMGTYQDYLKEVSVIHDEWKHGMHQMQDNNALVLQDLHNKHRGVDELLLQVNKKNDEATKHHLDVYGEIYEELKHLTERNGHMQEIKRIDFKMEEMQTLLKTMEALLRDQIHPRQYTKSREDDKRSTPSMNDGTTIPSYLQEDLEAMRSKWDALQQLQEQEEGITKKMIDDFEKDIIHLHRKMISASKTSSLQHSSLSSSTTTTPSTSPPGTPTESPASTPPSTPKRSTHHHSQDVAMQEVRSMFRNVGSLRSMLGASLALSSPQQVMQQT